MKHLDILEKFDTFSYVYHSNRNDKLIEEFDKMHNLISSSGHALEKEPWPLDSGILLTAPNEKVIAGAFFNTIKYKEIILLHLIYVDTEYRRKGIYLQLHKLINYVGKYNGKKKLYSYIHSDNSLMTDYMISRVGYREVMKLVERSI